MHQTFVAVFKTKHQGNDRSALNNNPFADLLIKKIIPIMVIMIMKVIVKQRIIRSIDIQISMTHYIRPMNNERYIYQSKIILLSVWYVCGGVFPHAHLLVKSKEQARQCAIFRGRCFSFVRTIPSRKLMHAHRKERS
mgnify:CR=1 FL=1